MPNNQGKRFCRNKFKVTNNHNDFLERIGKSLYYGRLPKIPCLSLPVTELSAELFSDAHKGKSLKRLHVEDAAELSRNACVSPCSLVLALLYLERLKNTNPEYVSKMAPSELFLVSLMVSNKFIQDDGEDDEVFCSEWATSGGITLQALHQMEWEFLDAIDWRIYVGEQNFESGLTWLEHQIAIRQAKLRGWFTYTDMMNVATTFENVNLLKCLLTVYAALSISYLASILTLVASSYIVSQGTSLVNEYHKGLTSTNCSRNVEPVIDVYDKEIPEQDIIHVLNATHIVPQMEIYFSNKTIDFRIDSYLPSVTSFVRSDMLLLFWKKLNQIDFSTFPPNFLLEYLAPYNFVDVTSSVALNGIYLNVKQSSMSWFQREYSHSLAWQYPNGVRY